MSESGGVEQLREELARKAGQLATIQGVAARVNTTLDLDALLDLVLDALHAELGFDHTMLLLLTPGSDELVVRASRGYGDRGLGACVKVGQGPVGVAARRGKVLRMNNIRMKSRYTASMRHHAQVQVGGAAGVDAPPAPAIGAAPRGLPGLSDVDSQMAIPLSVPDRNTGTARLIGVIAVKSPRPGPFNALDQELVTTIASLAASALDNARLYSEQAELMNAYERFVPKQFLRFLERTRITDVQLGDQIEMAMSVLFSDIRSFTTLSEQMTPEENFAFLNAYLGYVAPAIQEHDGFIDKYIGDAIMALFPSSPDDAVRGGIGMLARVRAYNEHRVTRGRDPIGIGIGIHTGKLMLGTVGFADRMEGTVISDSVNLAARIEGLTKRYGAALMVTQDTVDGLVDRTAYCLRYLDRVKVKGKTEPVVVYEVFDADEPERKTRKIATLADFERGLADYYGRRFDAAIEAFDAVLSELSDDVVAAMFKARAQELVGVTLDDNWAGVVKLDSK